MKTLAIKNDARVMLIHNIQIPDKLVNGLLGTVIGLIFTNGEIDAIVVKFDDPNVGQEQRKSVYPNHPLVEQGGVPIKRFSLDYRPKRKLSKKSHHVRFKLIQFPLTLAWSTTGHKMQGQTIATGCEMVCYGGQKRFPNGLGYVMLSRCMDVNNVYIDLSFDFKKLMPNERALEENQKLEERSITNQRKAETFDIFYVNAHNLQRTNLENICYDPLALQSNIILLTETWFIPKQEPDWSWNCQGPQCHEGLGNP